MNSDVRTQQDQQKKRDRSTDGGGKVQSDFGDQALRVASKQTLVSNLLWQTEMFWRRLKIDNWRGKRNDKAKTVGMRAGQARKDLGW